MIIPWLEKGRRARGQGEKNCLCKEISRHCVCVCVCVCVGVGGSAGVGVGGGQDH